MGFNDVAIGKLGSLELKVYIIVGQSLYTKSKFAGVEKEIIPISGHQRK